MKIFLSCLCAVLLLAFAPPAQACKYCEMAASDPESARLSGQVRGQDFPLEGVVNQFQAVAPAANLAVPPSSARVATKVSDLPTTVLRRPVAPPSALAAVKPMATKTVSAAPAAASAHWADAGLLSLAAAGGFFCWRTRRTPAPQV